MTAHRLEPDRDARIATLTRQGMSAAQIAVRVGVTKRTVCRARRRTGTSLGEAQVPMSPEETRRVESLLDDGCSLAEALRTIGRAGTGSIRRRFAGRAWTKQQIAAHAALIRKYA